MSLEYILYYSRALIPAEPAAHNAILDTCRVNNSARDVTGFLHREENFFLQYLEGPSSELDALLNIIGKDDRHSDVQIILREPLQTRRLPDWQMGFVNGDQMALVDVIGTDDGELSIKTAHPDDLIDFIIENADSLSGEVLAA
ncbi:MAG: BLUF domain-containing protein [Pseudomonadota bacterium]